MSACRPGNPVDITWRDTPPSPAQLVAWNALWARLLFGHVDPSKKREPQDHVGPGASNGAAVASGSHIEDEHTYGTTHALQSR